MKIGIIGTGLMGQEHIQNFALLSSVHDVQVVALADTNEKMLHKAAQLTQNKTVTTTNNYRDLILDPAIDALVLATPNYKHIDMLPELISSGKAILCEKPLCTEVNSCLQTLDLLSNANTIFQVGMEYRYKPALANMIQQIHSEKIGALQMLTIREHRMPFLHKVGNWNRFNRNTGGTLVEKCCHFFDLMRYIIGSEPTTVMASAGQNVNHLEESYGRETPDIWDNGYVIVNFENGSRALLDLCMFAENARHHEELAAIGNLGKIECLLPQNDVVLSMRAEQSPQQTHVAVREDILASGHHHGATYFQNQAFIQAVRGEREVEVTARDGYLAVAMGVAAQLSATQQRVVSMTEILAGPTE